LSSVFKGEHNSLELLSEQYHLIGMLNSFNNIFQAKADAFFKDISWKQIYILVSITLFEEAPTIREIANLTGSTHQNTTQILLKLEEKKLIFFQTDENDRRKRRVFLTDKGLQLCKEQEQPVDLKMNQLFSEIDLVELQTTMKVISKLKETVKEM